MTSAAPILLSEFSEAFEALGPFETNPTLAVGVSGGADSMALCLLLNVWAKTKGGKVIGVTVDHGLRAESTDEAKKVGGWLAAKGIKHHILRWEKDQNPESNIQELAREARLELLGDFCKQNNILHLCLGHHQDDMAENFLMRLSRGSGVYGLAAMPSVSYRGDVRILRPLLHIPKLRLITTLQNFGQMWIEDPSNDNEDFLRVQFRKNQALFDSLGLTAKRLFDTAKNFTRAKDALTAQIAGAAVQSITLYPTGYVTIDHEKFAGYPEEIGLRLLANILACVGGKSVTPRLESLSDLYRDLLSNTKTAKTLSGCIVETTDHILICREPGLIENKTAITAKQGRGLWDGRFLAEWLLPTAQDNLYIGSVTEKGWAELVQIEPKLRQTPIPFAVRLGLPAIWRQKQDLSGAEILAIPHLNYWKNAEISALQGNLRLAFHPQHKIAG